MNPIPVHFHVDLDAFFASVEQLDNPEYRGKPVIIGGDPASRGVVSTCSYEARAFGVHSAMPMARAVQLCPQAVFLPGRMHRYHEKSREVMRIFSDFSPEVRQVSVDEAFLLMTGTERLFGPPPKTARALKEAVLRETGLTVSVGVAANRYIAKIASGRSKPDGLVVVPPGEEEAFMAALPLKDVWGVGEKTRARLEAAGLPTAKAIRDCSFKILGTILGPAGASYLHQVLSGQDPGIFAEESASRSVSCERTFSRDIADPFALETSLLELSSETMYRLRDQGLSGPTVHVKIRYGDFRTVSVQETLDRSPGDSKELYERAVALFRKKWIPGEPVRLLGVGVFNVSEGGGGSQMELFGGDDRERRRAVEEAIHRLSRKRGQRLVTKARLLPPREEP